MGKSLVISLWFSVVLTSSFSALASSAVAVPPTSSTVSQSVTTLAQLQHTLARYSIVRGRFTQQRNMAMFDKPLRSQGRFLLHKTRGLLWSQHTPFPVDLVLTQDKLSQRFAQQPAQIITAKQNPMAFYFSHIFLAVFNGNTEQLKQQFDVTFSHDKQGWRLQLTPQKAPLNAVFSQIILQGRLDIDHLELQELRGDTTRIDFTQQTHQPEQLTDAEQSQFNF